MKRLLQFCAVLALLMLLPAQVSAQVYYWKETAKADFAVDGLHYKYTYSNSSSYIDMYKYDDAVVLTAVVSYNGTSAASLTEFEIPATVDYGGTTYKVVGVGQYATTAARNSDTNNSAFMDCSKLEKLTISANVQALFRTSWYANFFGAPSSAKKMTEYVVDSDNPYFCSLDGVIYTKNMKELVVFPPGKMAGGKFEIPNSVEIVRKGAFYHSSLDEVVFDKQMNTINERTFKNASISKVNLKEGVETIGRDAFRECRNLPTIDIPNTVKEIHTSAFEWCVILDNIVIPSGVTAINDRVFRLCYNLKNITLPSTITSIGQYAFQNCKSLPTINLGDLTSLEEIKIGAFSICRNLNNITIPSNVTRIGNYAFGGCLSLTAFNIPDNCELGKGVLFNTPRLETITNTNITRYTLDTSGGLTHGILYGSSAKNGVWDELVYFIPKNKIGKENTTMIRQFIVPNHVRKICAGSMGIHNIESLILPSELTTIEEYAFARFWSTTNPNQTETTTPYTDEEKQVLTWYMKELTIPAKVTDVNLTAFFHQVYEKGASSYAQTKTTAFNSLYFMGTPTVNLGGSTGIPNGDNDEAFFSNIFAYKINSGKELKDDVKVYVKASAVNKFSGLNTRLTFEGVTRLGIDIPVSRLTGTENGKVITMSRDFDIDFSNATGMKAYIATGYDEGQKGYTMQEVTYVPSRTGADADNYHGIILVQTDDAAGTYRIGENDYNSGSRQQAYTKAGGGTADLSTNRLVGVVANTHVQATEGDLTNWGLSSGKWQRIVNTGRLTPWDRAYLQPTKEETQKMTGGKASSAKVLVSMIFDDNTPTGISLNRNDDVNGNGNVDIWHTLQGVRLNQQPTAPGIYIHNGRKEVIR